MSPEQIRLVKSTWSKVEPVSGAAATLFYGRLFELDPALRPLFKPDLDEQKLKLAQTLSFAVAGLDQPEILLPIVRQLGDRHRAYGVEDSHYDTAAAALLWTLEKGLGPEWTPEAAAAWTAAYLALAGAMKEGAK